MRMILPPMLARAVQNGKKCATARPLLHRADRRLGGIPHNRLLFLPCFLKNCQTASVTH
ncbi:MAG TPA: hypothetical protein DEF41_13370 [Desulfovibrio sp.]|uniref:Uncharacterized protein n=1 Tax=Nitratidesulfovibrio vulgaris (strain ATCC 29579 / DSM 644 / CCUG 34227 / NCIMB 8303 / VKM B-1760 / Hildenborough) TaxID=882 RepID=Q72EN1_NITV2|nr:hypothetical protein DVU_0546 [Nitratidesulfovibrio vulgaris str. Hildenborough]HBW17074.1 hypothetical protein [Desulfovibrio sp.]